MSVVSLHQEPLPRAAAGPLLGLSVAMQEVFRLIERVGPTEASVLLTAVCVAGDPSSPSTAAPFPRG